MSNSEKHRLSIHHSNFFHPKPLGIKHIARNTQDDLLAVAKEYLNKEELDTTLTIIEIYRIAPKKAANLIQTIHEYENITGICWIGGKKILTVSREQTINVYSVKEGLKVNSVITDYGPINCMRFVLQENLLITGTEYGYISVYRIVDKGIGIEPISKMVKINGCIRSIAYHFSPREQKKPQENKTPTRPGKRKRSDSSEESADDDGEDKQVSKNFLDLNDITIYGASGGDVVAWDYHKKIVIETMRIGEDPCQVNAVLCLKNGNIVIGDSSGTLSIYDHNTFTCRQSTQVLEADILCLTVDFKQKMILTSGKDPTIVVMRKNKVSPDEYVLFEKIELHLHDVTALDMGKHKELISSSMDGFLARSKIKGEKRTLNKTITLPDYKEHTKLFGEELLIKYEKSLVLWKLPKSDSSETGNGEPNQLSPVKLLLLKAKTYIHSASFCDQWIAYSTRRGVHLFSRSEQKLVCHHTNKKIPNCSSMEFCSNASHLVAASGETLYLIDLSKKNGSLEENQKMRVLTQTYTGSSIRHIVNVPSLNLIAVASGPFKNMIHIYQIAQDPKDPLKKLSKVSFQGEEISFMRTGRFENKDNSLLYVYTNQDRLVKIDLSADNLKGSFSISDNSTLVKGLPNDINILGMVIITENHCILYDNHKMFKIDMNSMEVVNVIANYDYIIKLDNFVFNKIDQVALVELTPEDYRKALPITQHRRKFGQ